MSDWVYGFHAVEALLRREPKAIEALWLEVSRRDKRAQALLRLASDQGVAVERVTGAALDEVAAGRHQGIAVQVKSGAVTDAIDEAAPPPKPMFIAGPPKTINLAPMVISPFCVCDLRMLPKPPANMIGL